MVPRRTWRQLHLAVDEKHQWIACELTTPEVGDPTAVVVPPPQTAVLSPKGNTQRDEHIRTIEQQGRMAWQKQTGYHLRNYAELAVLRFKRIFGNTMKARALPQQITEARIGASALNRMTRLGVPLSVKFA